jgi:hypothetical protein
VSGAASCERERREERQRYLREGSAGERGGRKVEGQRRRGEGPKVEGPRWREKERCEGARRATSSSDGASGRGCRSGSRRMSCARLAALQERCAAGICATALCSGRPAHEVCVAAVECRVLRRPVWLSLVCIKVGVHMHRLHPSGGSGGEDALMEKECCGYEHLLSRGDRRGRMIVHASSRARASATDSALVGRAPVCH